MKRNNNKMRLKHLSEQRTYNLVGNQEYCLAVMQYSELFSKRKPYKNTATKNMLTALRLLPRLNTPDDWARLHMTEAYLD